MGVMESSVLNWAKRAALVVLAALLRFCVSNPVSALRLLLGATYRWTNSLEQE